MYYVSLSNRVTLPYKWQTISSLQPPAARHQAARTPETREYFPNYKYCPSVVCLQEPVDDEFYFLSYILMDYQLQFSYFDCQNSECEGAQQ